MVDGQKVTAAAVAVVILAALVLVEVTAGDGSPRVYLSAVFDQSEGPTATNTPRPTNTPNPTATATRPPNCHPSYPTVCIPPPPPDLNCPDIPYKNFTVLWSVPDPDPHDFDRDKDGIGCETP